MAERFARGGRLVALGVSPAARSDVRHVTVEFVHPVIVGKRALPAIGLTRDGGPLAGQVGLITEPDDIVIAFGALEPGGEEVRAALAEARERGCLTIAFEADAGAEWELPPQSADPSVRQELAETAYHVLWELVHVFFEHRGLLEGREAGPVHDSGASSFLYPFLSEGETRPRLGARRRSRARSLMKAEEVGALREQTLGENREALVAAAADLRRGLRRAAASCSRSATAARRPTRSTSSPTCATRRTRLARAAGDRPDRGHGDHHRGRQRRRHRCDLPAPGDRLRARRATRSSRSRPAATPRNVIEALAEARRRGAADDRVRRLRRRRRSPTSGLADHVVITRSQHIPRIQEAQASAYHALRELIELGG